MKYLSFLVNDEFYAADVTLVQKVVRKMLVTPVPAAPDAVIGIANLKGRVVTMLSLPELFDCTKKRKRKQAKQAFDAVVMKSSSGNNDQMGLIINKPGDLVDIEPNEIGKPCLTTGAEESFFISGIAEIGGTVYRIIDTDSIAAHYREPGMKSQESIIIGGSINGEN
jgi:purine-binding chemotaxis protein CheW